MGNNKNDGGLQSGSRKIRISENWYDASGKLYVAQNFNVSDPSSTIEQKDEGGAPSKQRSTDGFVTGTATLQYPDDDTWCVRKYMEFEVKGRITDETGADDVSEKFYISEVGTAETQEGQKLQNITFRKLLNPSAKPAS